MIPHDGVHHLILMAMDDLLDLRGPSATTTFLLPGLGPDCQKSTYLHVFQNRYPNVTAFLSGACPSKILICVLNKTVLRRKTPVQPDVTIQHAAKSLLSDGVTKPKQCQAMEILLELFCLLDLRLQVCRSSCVQVLQRGMNCKEEGRHLKNQVANKTQSTLKLLSRNVHFTAISAVSDSCLRIQK